MKTLRSVMLAGVVGSSALLAAGTASAFWGGGSPFNMGGWNNSYYGGPGGWGGPMSWGGPMGWGGGYPGYGWGGGYPGYGGYGGGYPYYGGSNYSSAPYSGDYGYQSAPGMSTGSKPAEPAGKKPMGYSSPAPTAK